MFENVSWLSTIGMNTNKNQIWSIFVVCTVSLYLLPMKSSIIKATYDTLRDYELSSTIKLRNSLQ